MILNILFHYSFATTSLIFGPSTSSNVFSVSLFTLNLSYLKRNTSIISATTLREPETNQNFMYSCPRDVGNKKSISNEVTPT